MQQSRSLPLWRGFTDKCTGYSLGFRYKTPNILSDEFFHWAPERVVYSRDKQRNLVRDIVQKSSQELDNSEDPFAWTIPLGDILTLKSPLFSSEREWRVIWREHAAYPVNKGQYTPDGATRDCHYIELPLSNLELVEIISGPRANLRADSPEILESIKAFGVNPDSVRIVESACKLWR
ncbi:DUF2971 domain-containing protein [Armatimonas sp.]|uniref:DUF2971 domain-containing protein n=1 Tax=Armatimonas sp. TaxID=1872638 RepID=UPI00286CB92D|nr:DUF2971 domain-containing protein [Armatimonas sp.]